MNGWQKWNVGFGLACFGVALMDMWVHLLFWGPWMIALALTQVLMFHKEEREKERAE